MDIDAALGLRDQDNCVGPDTFFPAGTALTDSALGQQLGPDQSNRVYQMAAFAMATSDKAAKQALLNGIQSRVGDDAFFGAMTIVINDVTQSRAVVAADQNMANDFASRLVSTGLNGLLPTARPQAALALDVESWILRRLTGPLVSRALDMMSAGAGAITAECALNQLAKEGFTEVAIGQ